MTYGVYPEVGISFYIFLTADSADFTADSIEIAQIAED